MLRRAAILVLVLAGGCLVLGLAFAGSPTRIADGVRIDGVDVGGLEASSARALLERKADALSDRPVVFVAAGKRFAITPKTLGVEADWPAAIDAAQRQGSGFGPLRGFRRLDVQVFGADVTPPTTVLSGALGYELQRIAARVDRPHRDAALVRHGLSVAVRPAKPGLVLDRRAASETIVHALASLQRPTAPVRLPLRAQAPRVRAADLAAARRQARTALSAPVRLTLGKTSWRVTPKRLASVLQLPSGGRTRLRVAGAAADHWLAALGRRVRQPARDARFTVDGSSVAIVPSQPGVRLDASRTADALLRAALKPARRTARVAVESSPAKLSTARARAMGVEEEVASYTTTYGGIANRIHNVQLVAHLVDDKLIPPGTVFSFNDTTGARTAAKGFLEAPVIINGEVTTGLGGGVCQVSTTVFNAAFEAGLPIVERINHALYISHYPQGRDATVDYPSVDLKFRNDTGHWLLLRTFVGSDSLTVGLYGTPTHRRVESTTAPLVSHGGPPVEKTVDHSLKPGEVVVDDPGVPAMTTSVTRDVYAADGAQLDHDVFYSSYQAVPKLVRVGPKKPKPPKHKPQQKKQQQAQATTTTGETATTQTQTSPAETTPSTTTTPTTTQATTTQPSE